MFHSFIREKALNEIWIGVANYAHVKRGPGVLLIAHHAHYAMDEGDGELGVLYARKRGAEGDTEARFVDALQRTKSFADAVTDAEGTSGKVSFETERLLLGAQDRLNAPNNQATFDAHKDAIASALTRSLGGKYTLTRAGAPRSPFTVLAERAA